MAKRPSKPTEKSTSPLRRFSVTTAMIPEALHSPQAKSIALQDLATKLGIPVSRLLPAIKSGYIKVITANPPVVYEPPPAALAWLREMYTPLVMRPLLEIAQVAELEGYSTADIRRLAIGYDIPIHMDECFGELFTITAWRRLHIALHYHREPSRFDRAAMLSALMALASPATPAADLKLPSFSKRLEREVKRIAELAEPHRTEQALRLWESFEQGKKVAECIAAAKGVKIPRVPAMDRAERMVSVPDAEMAPEEATPISSL